jgi:hypothetical protein
MASAENVREQLARLMQRLELPLKVKETYYHLIFDRALSNVSLKDMLCLSAVNTYESSPYQHYMLYTAALS